ncbi:MAG TPA: GNAT family N-acetyltransferase [Acidimicrobiia bacterium]|nr:GNAT family N-acetyltransferase [Acidimicrobiia bacterium]
MRDVQITDNSEAQRYEARAGGQVVGYASHRNEEPGRLVILHVEVDPACEGHGIGTHLVEHALADARSRDLTVVPRCSFAAAVMSGRVDPNKDR